MDREKAIEILNALGIKEDVTEEELNKKLYHIRRDNDNIYGGETKDCLVLFNLDYVIKWNKTIIQEEKYDECLREYLIYLDAKEEGLEKVFPKTDFIKFKNGFTCIIQQKVDCSCGSLPFRTEKKYNAAIAQTFYNKINNNRNFRRKIKRGFIIEDCICQREIDNTWLSMVAVLYGKKFLRHLEDFVQKHKINDLHGENIGYLKKRPMFIDFSGYDNK